MKLNIDCVRDILLTIENTGYGQRIIISSLSQSLPKYDADTVIYAVEKLCEANYIECKLYTNFDPDIGVIQNITYEGHTFLENIRQPSNWEKVKSACSKIGSFALPIMKNAAENIILEQLPSIIQSLTKET